MKKIETKNSVIIRPNQDIKIKDEGIRLEGEIPKMAYCHHCGVEREFILKTGTITRYLNNVKISFSSMIPYCLKCGGECYIHNLEIYNKKMTKFIYLNKNKKNEVKSKIDL